VTFPKNMSLPSSGSKNMPSKAPLATWFHSGFLFGLFFHPEDRGHMFLRNVGWLSTHYTALYITITVRTSDLTQCNYLYSTQRGQETDISFNCSCSYTWNVGISLYTTKIVMMLRDIMVTQCHNRAQQTLTARSTNSVGRWIC
jgi:hypothetical protein